jgi:hypothetical protein
MTGFAYLLDFGVLRFQVRSRAGGFGAIIFEVLFPSLQSSIFDGRRPNVGMNLCE